MIRLEGVTKIYDGGKRAVANLNLTIKKGEIFGFLGPNGAGKTTTLRMITGILAPTAGKITINGYDIQQQPVAAKKSFTYVPDHPEIFSAIRGIDYLNFIADIYEIPIAERKEKIKKYTRDFEIYDELGKSVNSYSHGMRQKLLISGALLPDPEVFILDEPLGGLDPRASRILKNLMREHCQKGGTVFFSSHVLEVVENLCDRVAIINQGELIACDSPKKLKQATEITLEDIFLELTENE